MKTEIAFILDRSGSMSSMTSQAISGFNEFLAGQQATLDDHGKPIPATFSLVLFDNEYRLVHDRVDIQTAHALNAQTYTPRGSTALLDAIGRTIDHIGSQLAATPEADRPSKVIIAILTDGEENSSRKYSMSDINQRITHQTEKYQWEFMFLGANQDAIATAARMGIRAHAAAAWNGSPEDLQASNKALAIKIQAYRRRHSDSTLTEEELDDLHSPICSSLEKSRKPKN